MKIFWKNIHFWKKVKKVQQFFKNIPLTWLTQKAEETFLEVSDALICVRLTIQICESAPPIEPFLYTHRKFQSSKGQSFFTRENSQTTCETGLTKKCNKPGLSGFWLIQPGLACLFFARCRRQNVFGKLASEFYGNGWKRIWKHECVLNRVLPPITVKKFKRWSSFQNRSFH